MPIQIEIDSMIGERGHWAEGVRRANDTLELVIGRSQDQVTAQWVLTVDEQRQPRLQLTLSDALSSVENSFAPDELDDAEHLWFRLHRLYGDLLRVRSHKQLEELQKSLAGLEGNSDA